MGYDQYSYGYRDLEGSRVHKALREAYGSPFREGDVVGCLLHLPPGGAALHIRHEVRRRTVARGVRTRQGLLRPRGLVGLRASYLVPYVWFC